MMGENVKAPACGGVMYLGVPHYCDHPYLPKSMRKESCACRPSPATALPDGMEVVAWTNEGAISVLTQHWPTVDCITVSAVMTPQTETGLVRANQAQSALAAMRVEIERLSGLTPELPPYPPEGEGLPRFGLRWNGPEQPLAVPMDDGYWTPYHLASLYRRHCNAAERDLSEVSKAIGSVRWMDPPDGGDVSLGEQVNRMRTDLETAEAQVQRLTEDNEAAHEARERAGCLMSLAECIDALSGDCRAAEARIKALEEALTGLIEKYESIVLNDDEGRSLKDHALTVARAILTQENADGGEE